MSVREDIREQRKQLKGKGVKAHLSWFWTYEKVPVIIAVVAVLFVAFLVHGQLTQKKTVFSAVFLNASTGDTGLEADTEASFGKVLNINPDKEEVSILFSLYQTPGNPTGSTYDLATQTAIDGRTEEHDLDILATEPDFFSYYLNLGDFSDLRDVLSEEEQKKYQDDFYYVDLPKLKEMQKKVQDPDWEYPVVAKSEAEDAERVGTYERPDPSKMEDPVPVGIFITDTAWMQEHKLYGSKECVLGFVQGSTRTDAARKFLTWLDTDES